MSYPRKEIKPTQRLAKITPNLRITKSGAIRITNNSDTTPSGAQVPRLYKRKRVHK